MTFADSARLLHGAHKPWRRGLVRPRRKPVVEETPLQRAFTLGLVAGQCDRQWWGFKFATGAEYAEALRGWRRGQLEHVADLCASDDEAVRLEGRRRSRWLVVEG